MDFTLHRSIAERIQSQTEKELADVDNSELPFEMKCAQRYRVMQTAFDQIIDESKSYKEILKTIKMSYDDYLQHLEQTKNSSITLSSKLKNMAARPATLANLRKRGDQLEDNLLRLRDQNNLLQDQLLNLHVDLEAVAVENPSNSPRVQFGEQFHSKKSQIPKKKSTERSVKPLFDQLTVEQCLDEEVLRDTLKSLTAKLESVKSQREKFVSKSEHDSYWNEYQKKSEQKALLESTYQGRGQKEIIKFDKGF